jgi:hypothetical protein
MLELAQISRSNKRSTRDQSQGLAFIAIWQSGNLAIWDAIVSELDMVCGNTDPSDTKVYGMAVATTAFVAETLRTCCFKYSIVSDKPSELAPGGQP